MKFVSRVKNRLRDMFGRRSKLKYIYAYYYKYAHIQNNLILFESFHGKNISDSPLAVLKELLLSDERDKFQIYVVSNNIEKHTPIICDLNSKFNVNVKLVYLHSIKYVKILASAK